MRCDLSFQYVLVVFDAVRAVLNAPNGTFQLARSSPFLLHPGQVIFGRVHFYCSICGTDASIQRVVAQQLGSMTPARAQTAITGHGSSAIDRSDSDSGLFVPNELCAILIGLVAQPHGCTCFAAADNDSKYERSTEAPASPLGLRRPSTIQFSSGTFLYRNSMVGGHAWGEVFVACFRCRPAAPLASSHQRCLRSNFPWW